MLKTLKTFYGFVFRKKLIFIGFILLVISGQILGNITPYLYKLFVQSFPAPETAKVMHLLALYLTVNLGALGFDVVSFWVGDYLLFNAAIWAREEIFERVQNLDFAFHTGKSTGSLISAFKRGDSAFFTLFFQLHHQILEVIVGAAVMFYFFSGLDLKIALLAISSTAVTIFITKFLVTNNVQKRSVFNKEEDEVSAILTDNFINYETVKLFAKEKWEANRLKNRFITWKKALWGYGNSFRLIDITIGGVINVFIFLILWVTLKKVVSLNLSIGDFVLVTTFINLFFAKLWSMVWGMRDIAKTYADIQNYFGLLDYQVEVKDPDKPIVLKNIKGKIEFDRVSFSYKDGKKDTLKNLSLKIAPGESVALVGRSGSGKTTFIKLLLRFFDPNEGAIKIDGVNLKELTKMNLRSLTGVVPQEPILFNSTIGYNIGYGRSGTTTGEIRAAARLANIDEFIEVLPQKYETQVGERGVKLSGGQKQRLAIARMILSDPKIIIFDEATSHLDSESEKLIQEAFWKAARGKTTIIIAHRLSTVAQADRIVVLENGKVKEIGTHRSLLAQKDSLYKHFWDLQINLD